MQPESHSSLSPQGCTPRALIIGVVGAVFLALGSVYNDMMIKGPPMARWSLTPAAIFTFFFLVAIVNVLLGYVRQSLVLQRSELAVAYVLMVIGNSLASGISGYVLPVITGAYYFASSENNWREIVQPHLPTWIGPNDASIIRDFYEGNPTSPIPWEAWLLPLLLWLAFALTLFLVMVCAMVILRRQWVEHEKLAYPMAQLPLAMIVPDPQGGLVGPLFRKPIMWIGFSLPFTLGSIDALSKYFAFFPAIRLSIGSVPLFDGNTSLNLSVYPSIVGFSYLIHQNVALGLWVFHLVSQLQRGVISLLGAYEQETALGHFSRYLDPIIFHQAMGAMIILVLGFLWSGRQHLLRVLRKAVHNDPTVSDIDEILSYRSALLGIGLGITCMAIFLWQTGIPLFIVPLLLFGAFVIFLTITREAVQGGVAAMYTPTVAADFVLSSIGGETLGARGLAGLALTYPWSTGRATMMVPMVVCANGLKLVSEVDLPNRRRLFGAIITVILLVLVSTVSLIFYLAYQHGAINLNWYFQTYARYPYEFMAKNVHNLSGPNLNGWLYRSLGGIIMAGLLSLHHRFIWWPLHPVGFPIGCLFGRMWFSVFIAWLLKSIILRYGGIRLFAFLRPFFLGLILGELVVAGSWVGIDYFTGMQNNHISGVVF